MSQQTKPNTVIAMRNLIATIKQHLPFRASTAELCRKPCNGCTKKLMRFLEQEVDNWDFLLGKGETPSLGDVNRLARISRKIYKVLDSNRLEKTNKNL